MEEAGMTRRQQMQLPAGIFCMFAGLILKRFGGESWPVLAIQILMFGCSIFLNIRYMLRLRVERSDRDGSV